MSASESKSNSYHCEIAEIVSKSNILETICQELGITKEKLTQILPQVETADFEQNARKSICYMISQSNLERVAKESDWPVSKYWRMNQVLQEQFTAGTSFRRAPNIPISVEDWRHKAMADVQGNLFEDDLEQTSQDDTEEPGYPLG